MSGSHLTSRANDETIEVGQDQLEQAYEIRIAHLPWQANVRREVLLKNKKLIVLACGARCGKDVLCSNLAVELALRLAIKRKNSSAEYRKVPRVNLTVVAPRRALYAQTQAELQHLLGPLMKRMPGHEHIYQAPGDIKIYFKTVADGHEYLVSDAPDIVLFTEASRTSEEDQTFEESLLPRLMSPGSFGLALLNGTPRVGRNHWYRKAFEQALVSPNGLAVQLPSWENPDMRDKGKLMHLRAHMTQQQFAVEIAAQWPDTSLALFSEDDFEAMLAYIPREVFDNAKWVVGVDPASTKDAFAIAVFAITRIGIILQEVHWLAPTSNLQEQIMTLAEINRRYYRCDFYIDSHGMGGQYFYAAAKESIRGANIYEYNLHSNEKKQDIISGLIKAFEARTFAINQNEISQEKVNRLWDELSKLDSYVTDTGLVAYSGQHDDMVIACALGWFGAQLRYSAECARYGDPRTQPKTSGNDLVNFASSL